MAISYINEIPSSSLQEHALRILALARQTWPHMHRTADIYIHDTHASGTPNPPRPPKYTAFLIDRAYPDPAVANLKVWYRSDRYGTREAALGEIASFVKHMRRVRAWSDEVRAATEGQVPKLLPLRPSVVPVEKGEQ